MQCETKEHKIQNEYEIDGTYRDPRFKKEIWEACNQYKTFVKQG